MKDMWIAAAIAVIGYIGLVYLYGLEHLCAS